MNLIQKGEFKLHSGRITRWKLDCDALSYEDLEAAADIIVNPSGMGLRFTEVIGVPSGGLALAAKLRPFCRPVEGQDRILIVDDVYTSGDSIHDLMAEIRKERRHAHLEACVIFNRNTYRTDKGKRQNSGDEELKAIFDLGVDLHSYRPDHYVTINM